MVFIGYQSMLAAQYTSFYYVLILHTCYNEPHVVPHEADLVFYASADVPAVSQEKIFNQPECASRRLIMGKSAISENTGVYVQFS
jgi:hypothetical protein